MADSSYSGGDELRQGERLPPPKMVISTKAVQESKLLPDASNAVPVSYYLYGENDSAEATVFNTPRKYSPTKLLNWWASWVALGISTGLLAYAINFVRTAVEPNSGLLITSFVVFIIAPISMVLEFTNIFPRFLMACTGRKKKHMRVGHHAFLHLVMTTLSLLPFTQHCHIMGILFLLHVVPGVLFYVARIRREPTAAKLLQQQQQQQQHHPLG